MCWIQSTTVTHITVADLHFPSDPMIVIELADTRSIVNQSTILSKAGFYGEVIGASIDLGSAYGSALKDRK